MPLRDHFRPPLDDRTSWDGLHGAWPTLIVMGLASHLPARYVAAPNIRLGSSIEIDVAAFRGDEADGGPVIESDGGVATAVWAPPRPTLAVATESPEDDKYEVRVFDARRGRRLVAAVEIVSPSNKDRPEHRRAFVVKCAALLLEGSASPSSTSSRPGPRTFTPNSWICSASPTRPWPPIRPSSSRRRSIAGRGPATAGSWRPGRTPSSSANRGPSCRSGWHPISRYRSTWNKATKRRVECSGPHDRAPGRRFTSSPPRLRRRRGGTRRVPRARA